MLWKTSTRTLDLSRHAIIMGILNATPDSFSDGGLHQDLSPALAHARKMIAEGAEIIDIGGESTRPSSYPISADEEIKRTIPIIAAVRSEWRGLISIDTTKASVARAALTAGADIVNDISGLTADPMMSSVCVDSDCGIVIMHLQGTPADMQKNPHYDDVLAEIKAYFQQRFGTLTHLGIDPERLCFDPGIGFGKNLEHHLTLLKNLDTLAPAGRPLLLGVSRKSFISKIIPAPDPADREAATIALTAFARQKNVMLHRVHSVKSNLEALRTVEALL
ncbi:MAG: dihydropteroate synthase [Armatimonadetes bacterium]|nr:dihydropteroate synthase [Akkermansiaceae bacterium]